MMAFSIARMKEEGRVVYELGGELDRASAWALREQVNREEVGEVMLDFTLVRKFSDLGVAVLAHGLTGASQRVVFRGLRPHELRIFRSCGVAVDELSAREPALAAEAASQA